MDERDAAEQQLTQSTGDYRSASWAGEGWAGVRVPRQRRRRMLRAAVGASAAVLVVGGASLVVDSAVASNDQTTVRTQDQPMPGSGPLYRQPAPQQGTTSQSEATPAGASQLSGLVRIQTEVDFGQGEAAGTGMVLTSDGEVVTNHHVVAGATEIQATDMSTGRTYTAQVVGTDAHDDVAVLKLENASGLSTVRTDTDGLSVGDQVTAVGDANGAERLSAADGTVTALDQSITTQTDGAAEGEHLRGLIRLDADVISGDSGGATYDDEGEVVGMTTAASSGSANITGYAIPIDKVLSVAEDLTDGVQSVDYAYGYPAFLGVALGPGGSATVQGVYDDSAAERAGIGAGDTITALDGRSVDSAQSLSDVVAGLAKGERAQVSWIDQTGQQQSARVTLGEGPVA